MQETPYERDRRGVVERAAEASEFRGKPLPVRPRLGPPRLERYLTAVGGPLAYMVRLRTIEDQISDHLAKLELVWRALAEQARGQDARFASAWCTVASAWDFSRTNALIEKHNRYYPIEANLPMDPRTGDFALVAGKPYTREPLRAGWVLDRFPPLLGRARAPG